MVHPPATVLAVVVLSCTSATAQTITIDHSAVACAVAERYPQFQARFTPPEV